MPLVQDLLRPYARVATSNRFFLYGIFSTVATSLVIFNAFWNFGNFYSVAVYLSRSNRSVLVLANFGLLCSLIVGRVLQQIFFGSLRATEVERLYDRIWFFLTESLLAFTIFRDEFDVSFGVMFGFLLFVKCFHWLMSFRIEWMDQIQYPGPNSWFHVRMNVLFLSLWAIDVLMICFAVESIMSHGIGGVILFASEYAILVASLLNSMAKYLIIFYDIRRAGRHGGENAPVWEDKSMYIFYVELTTDFLKLMTYMAFFLVVLTFYGLPLNIVRDIYITGRSFFQRCRDLVRYRTATRNMDERYPDATEEELNQMNDKTCIICREEMVARDPNAPAEQRAQGVNDTPKKLPCGHVFHFHCLRSWLERQQSCPTCRRTVLETRQPLQNAQARGQAPPPQPGAIPQLQGFGAPAQQGPQGFLARWLGGAGAAPPIVPGQFAPGPQGFNQLPNQIPLQGAGFPQQNPFGPWHQPGFYAPPQQQQQQQPGPVQVLQGFYIGNQWQPWGQQPQPGQLQQQQRQQQPPAAIPVALPAQVQPVAAPQAQPLPAARPPTPVQQTTSPSQAGPSTTQAASSTTPQVEPGHTTPASTSSSSEPSPSSSSASAPDAAGNLSPREQAALAALRRMTSNSNGNGTVSHQIFSSPPTEMGAQSSSATRSTPTPTIPEQLSSSSSNTQPNPISVDNASPASSSTQAGSASISHPQSQTQEQPPTQPPRGAVPSLIPLFDPATTHATIVPPPPPTADFTRRFNNNQYPGYGHSTFRPPRAYNFGGVAQGSLPNLRDLPQTLTQEQLERLDTLTREAIDERLRALENIQGVMWRCAEELVRIRSVLPVRSGPANSAAGPSSDSASSLQPQASTSGQTVTGEAGVQGATSQAGAASSSATGVPNPDSVVPERFAAEADNRPEAVVETGTPEAEPFAVALDP